MTDQENILKNETVDKELFDFFVSTDPNLLENLKPLVTEEEKQKFLSSDFSINPEIKYAKQTSQELSEKKELFETRAPFLMQAYIDSRPFSYNEKEELLSYYWRYFDNVRRSYQLLSASSSSDWAKFDEINEKKYESPSKEIFNTYLKNIHDLINESLQDQNLSSTAEELQVIIPHGGNEVFEETNIDLEQFRNILSSKMDPIIHMLQGYDSEYSFDSSKIKEVFEKGLSEIGAGDWQVEITDKYLVTTTNAIYKKIFVPSEKKLKRDNLLGLVAHEIFTHVQRYESSKELFPFDVLREGLPGYMETEEAIATFSEAAYNSQKKLDLGGGDLHFAVCLAMGLDGVKRDFKDTFKILYLVKKLKKLKDGKDLEKAETLAKDSAWNSTLRVFRGTPGNIPGLVFRKDIVYGEGRRKLIEYLKTHKESNIQDLWKARYTPWDTQHLEIVSKFKR